MKAFSRILYFFIFIFSAIYVFRHQNYTSTIEIPQGYVINFSAARGETVDFYVNPLVAHKKGLIRFYDVNHFIVDSIIAPVFVQPVQSDSLLYEKGFQYKNKLRYNTKNLKSGLYFIGTNIPFIVKEPNLKNAITIVFPYGNFMALNNTGGKSFDPDNSSHKQAANSLSLNRNVPFRDHPEMLIKWIDSVYQNIPHNVITDLDMEEYENIKNSKLLIIYGYSAFWTSKQRNNFDRYLQSGGNVLTISSYLMNNKYTFNPKQNKILFTCCAKYNADKSFDTHTGLWQDIKPNLSSLGCSYELTVPLKSIKSSNDGFKIIEKKHPIFNGVHQSVIGIDTQNSNSFSVKASERDTVPVLTDDLSNFESKVLLAYDYSLYQNKQTVTGMALLKKKESHGKLLVIGTEKWCWKDYFYRPDIQKITQNSIDYLLNN